jgi:hypothetical protein
MNLLTDSSLVYKNYKFDIYGYATMDSLPFARDAYLKPTLSTTIEFGRQKAYSIKIMIQICILDIMRERPSQITFIRTTPLRRSLSLETDLNAN